MRLRTNKRTHEPRARVAAAAPTCQRIPGTIQLYISDNPLDEVRLVAGGAPWSGLIARAEPA